MTHPLLCIDTSSGQGAIAVYDGERLSTRTWSAERSHTATLLTEIHHLLARSAIEPADLAAIGVAVGPGAFTGLRAGFGVAKGLHLATGAPLIGLPTLEATALPYADREVPIVATVGAGRGRLVWARYEGAGDAVVEQVTARNGTVDDLLASIADLPGVVVAGELDETQAEAISAWPGACIPPRALRHRLPAALAELAWRRFNNGQFDDAALLEPVYLSR